MTFLVSAFPSGCFRITGGTWVYLKNLGGGLHRAK